MSTLTYLNLTRDLAYKLYSVSYLVRKDSEIYYGSYLHVGASKWEAEGCVYNKCRMANPVGEIHVTATEINEYEIANITTYLWDKAQQEVKNGKT